jgi:hypothetical protein
MVAGDHHRPDAGRAALGHCFFHFRSRRIQHPDEANEG